MYGRGGIKQQIKTKGEQGVILGGKRGRRGGGDLPIRRDGKRGYRCLTGTSGPGRNETIIPIIEGGGKIR